ncbi:hypothetical protein Pelo_8197 [Pelomyxa schiedti]|nr:hypothetical protein Pelo_8197 [Pelomyxa schiedti]
MKWILVVATLVAVASGFMEDMCVKSGGGLTNFFQTAFDIGCKPGNTSRACLDAVSQAALVPASCCIGSIHMLSTFMMAQALGMKSEYAYQLAVYSSATDYDQFIACDACGTPLAKSLTPPPMSSMRRVNMTTGGFISHLPLTYDGHYGTGLTPDVHDHINEGFIASFRDWVYADNHHFWHDSHQDHRDDHHDHDGHKHHQEHHDGCLLGFTIPWIDENFFTGPMCRANDGYINTTATMFLTGTRTVTRQEMEQIWALKDLATFKTVKTVVDIVNTFGPVHIYKDFTLNDIDDWLRAFPGYSVLSNGKRVPEEIIKYGVYAHILGDRVSHYYCTDSKSTNMVRIHDTPPVYQAKYDPQMCNAGIHSLQHYWEIGHTPNVAQTASSLTLLWAELVDWTAEMKWSHNEWFKKQSKTVDVIAAMQDIVKVADAGTRLTQYLAKLQQFGFSTLPGFDNFSTVCTTKPHHDDKGKDDDDKDHKH